VVVDVVHASNDVDEVRARVVRALDEYIELSDRMRGFEAAFGAHVLHTAAQLNETISHRRRLEAEYERIRAKLARGDYADAAAVEDDVRSALVTTDTEHPDVGADGEPPSEAVAEELDEELDEATRERIVRDFKRIVLPSVHADTSDTPYAIFDVAYSAYKARDYTLMEAFVIRFRSLTPLTPEQAGALLDGYRAAERRLERRLRALRRDATYDELHDPEAARQRMRRQSEEFRRAIDEEAERLEDIRRRLQELLRHAREGHLDGVS
jgi:hypothetical protein